MVGVTPFPSQPRGCSLEWVVFHRRIVPARHSPALEAAQAGGAGVPRISIPGVAEEEGDGMKPGGSGKTRG